MESQENIELTEFELFFTIFIPTYNRGYLLERAIESIKKNDTKDLEVIVLDDGSKDDTEQVVKNCIHRFPDLQIKYIYQENQGKHVAHNTAIKHAKGEFVVILDSDDILAPNALNLLKKTWDNIPLEKREYYAGIEGLCAYISDKNVVGTKFPIPDNKMAYVDSNYMEMRRSFLVEGDKKNAIKTEVLKKYKFPTFPGEKFIPESLIWNRIAQKYKFRYINEIIQLVEYQADGLSSNTFTLRVKNPKGFRLYFQEEINLHSKKYIPDLKARLRNNDRYVRYSLHAGVPFLKQWRDIGKPILFPVYFLSGFIHFLSDIIREKKRRKLRSEAI